MLLSFAARHNLKSLHLDLSEYAVLTSNLISMDFPRIISDFLPRMQSVSYLHLSMENSLQEGGEVIMEESIEELKQSFGALESLKILKVKFTRNKCLNLSKQ